MANTPRTLSDEMGKIRDSLARNIKRYRQERDMTLEELATELGNEYRQMPYERQVIFQIERGKQQISVGQLYALARIFNCDPVDLLPNCGMSLSRARGRRDPVMKQAKHLLIQMLEEL